MNITSLGDNLNVIIRAQWTFAHDWMVFGLWHSINKNMPDAQVFLRLEGARDVDLFHWASKCRIKIIKHSTHGIDGKILITPPHLIMVRELNDKSVTYINQEAKPDISSSELCSDARSHEFSPFVSYKSGCGAFNWSEWIDKDGCPYDTAEGLMTHEAVVNEVKVLQYWAQLCSIYSTISKG